MDIFLIRHGEAAASWDEHPDPGLSPLGRQQALKVRDELEAYPDLHLVSSPLMRAQETAQPIASTLHASVVTDPRFREIPSPVGIEDRRAWLNEFMRQEWSDQGPDIHRWRNEAWEAMFEFESTTAVFTHFMIINALVSRLTEAPETVCCIPDNGSITHVRMEGRSLKLVSVGRQARTLVN